MSAAQRDLLPMAESATTTEAAASFALKEQVAQRLAAHRARRRQPGSASAVAPIANPSPAKARSAQIAAAVAERYANSPSYRAFLAAEAENAIREAEAARREAEAAAEVAALSAQAVADAQYELLAELDQWSLTPPPVPVAFPTPEASAPSEAASISRPGPDRTSNLTQGLTVKLFEEVARSASPSTSSSFRSMQIADEDEALALDDEIAFRHDPVFDEFADAGDLPANLIEFPRQLVAPRRARPRLAEGPLREDGDLAPDTAQLRIFEVEAAQISTAPAIDLSASVEPEWSSILLAAHPVSASSAESEGSLHPVFSSQIAPRTAPLSLRLMATVVDGCLIAAAFLAGVAAFAVTFDKLSADHAVEALSRPVALQTAVIGSFVSLAILALLYQILFFTFSDATPGMRYARIGLCTFADDNPTRRAMRRRIFAVLLAACPLGIGFLWAWLDEESLGWHDRISRMYQRSY